MQVFLPMIIFKHTSSKQIYGYTKFQSILKPKVPSFQHRVIFIYI